MSRCLISFGANLGNPAQTIGQAVEQLHSRLTDRLISCTLSRLFRTPAVGGPTGQPPFVNAVAALEVLNCTAWDVWHAVREIEHALGRVRQERWEARRIDLDVLLFDDQRIWTPQFKLPHPRMVMRRFILEPAADVASHWVEPVSGWSIQALARSLSSKSASIVLFSHQLQTDRLLIDRAAQTARAELLTAQIGSTSVSIPSPHRHERWLSILPIELLHTLPASPCITPSPQLVIVLAPPHNRPGAAWEDIHRATARQLDLCPSSSAQAPHSWPLDGPRYLLSTDDSAWAEHEILAALDAMDCPVEPMALEC